MNEQLTAYGNLCALFYDATKKYAPKKEVDFYTRFMKPGERVLEAMCGSGRLLIPLIQRGYTVDGIDNSPIMLDHCRKRLAELQIDAQLYEQSLETMSLPHRYHTVTVAVGSFQLITERIKAVQALKNLHAHMHKNGSLLIDFFVPEIESNEPSVRVAYIDEQTSVRLTTRHIFDVQQKKADGLCFYELIINGTVQKRENEVISVTWYTDNELKILLGEAGFELMNIYEESFRSSGPSRIALAIAQ